MYSLCCLTFSVWLTNVKLSILYLSEIYTQVSSCGFKFTYVFVVVLRSIIQGTDMLQLPSRPSLMTCTLLN